MLGFGVVCGLGVVFVFDVVFSSKSRQGGSSGENVKPLVEVPSYFRRSRFLVESSTPELQ